MRTLWGAIADLSWILLGALAWALQLGFVRVEVESYATGHIFIFPGWRD